MGSREKEGKISRFGLPWGYRLGLCSERWCSNSPPCRSLVIPSLLFAWEHSDCEGVRNCCTKNQDCLRSAKLSMTCIVAYCHWIPLFQSWCACRLRRWMELQVSIGHYSNVLERKNFQAVFNTETMLHQQETTLITSMGRYQIIHYLRETSGATPCLPLFHRLSGRVANNWRLQFPFILPVSRMKTRLSFLQRGTAHKKRLRRTVNLRSRRNNDDLLIVAQLWGSCAVQVEALKCTSLNVVSCRSSYCTTSPSPSHNLW